MTEPLTDEERQKLCEQLSLAATRPDKHGYYGPLCKEAAEEIERLCDVISELRSAEIRDRAKHEREIVMALGGRQHPSVR